MGVPANADSSANFRKSVKNALVETEKWLELEILFCCLPASNNKLLEGLVSMQSLIIPWPNSMSICLMLPEMFQVLIGLSFWCLVAGIELFNVQCNSRLN